MMKWAMPKRIAARAMLLAGIWWMLAGGAPDAWIVGAVVIVLALTASLYLHPESYGLSLRGLPSFLLFFFLQSIKGGLQVAAIALRPRLELHPGFVEIPLRLPRESEQVFLAAILSLLPGTLSAGLRQGRLQLHALDAGLPIEAEVRRAEYAVARLFRTELT